MELVQLYSILTNLFIRLIFLKFWYSFYSPFSLNFWHISIPLALFCQVLFLHSTDLSQVRPFQHSTHLPQVPLFRAPRCLPTAIRTFKAQCVGSCLQVVRGGGTGWVAAGGRDRYGISRPRPTIGVPALVAPTEGQSKLKMEFLCLAWSQYLNLSAVTCVRWWWFHYLTASNCWERKPKSNRGGWWSCNGKCTVRISAGTLDILTEIVPFCLPPASRWFLAKLIFSTLKMEAVCSSETPVDTQRTTRRYSPEDGTLQHTTWRYMPVVLKLFWLAAHCKTIFCRTSCTKWKIVY
jgi:hypothetical protein